MPRDLLNNISDKEIEETGVGRGNIVCEECAYQSGGCCPLCRSKNLEFVTVEVWQRDVTFKLENNELKDIGDKEPYLKEEVYDSRMIKCKECGWEINIAKASDEMKHLFNTID